MSRGFLIALIGTVAAVYDRRTNKTKAAVTDSRYSELIYE